MMLDPYYRTMEGFAILVEKEWLSFGHKFAQRHGHGTFSPKMKDTQRAPIFLQFIDCCWQMQQQFPTSFEFNERFLLMVVDACYSCLFGTFLCNTDQERRVLYKVTQGTISLWAFLRTAKPVYANPLFDRTHPGERLIPKTLAIQVWRGLYCRYHWASVNDLMGLVPNVNMGLNCATFNAFPKRQGREMMSKKVPAVATAPRADVESSGGGGGGSGVSPHTANRLTRGERSASVTLDDIDGQRRRRISFEKSDNESLSMDGPNMTDEEEEEEEENEVEQRLMLAKSPDEEEIKFNAVMVESVVEAVEEDVDDRKSEVMDWSSVKVALGDGLNVAVGEENLVEERALSPRQNASKRRGVKLDANELQKMQDESKKT
jgi:hypothetical protein